MFSSEGENIALLSLKAWHTDLDKLLLQYGVRWNWGGSGGKRKMFCGIIKDYKLNQDWNKTWNKFTVFASKFPVASLCTKKTGTKQFKQTNNCERKGRRQWDCKEIYRPCSFHKHVATSSDTNCCVKMSNAMSKTSMKALWIF